VPVLVLVLVLVPVLALVLALVLLHHNARMVITNARIVHRMVISRVVFWAGKDPDVLNRTYNLALGTVLVMVWQ